jgi:hypothetical protein
MRLLPLELCSRVLPWRALQATSTASRLLLHCIPLLLPLCLLPAAA